MSEPRSRAKVHLPHTIPHDYIEVRDTDPADLDELLAAARRVTNSCGNASDIEALRKAMEPKQAGYYDTGIDETRSSKSER